MADDMHTVLVCLNDDHDATTDLAGRTSQPRCVTCVCSRVYCVVTCDGFQSRVWLFASCPESQNARTLDPVCLSVVVWWSVINIIKLLTLTHITDVPSLPPPSFTPSAY